jgi:uncharacterized protein
LCNLKENIDNKKEGLVLEWLCWMFAKINKNGEKHMKVIDVIAMLLILIGGLNWGLVGFFDIDLVSAILGKGSGLSRLIFALVGLSTLYKIFFWQHIHARWCK